MSDECWEASAAAWIADQGEHGDYGRRWILDPVLVPRVRALAPRTLLDVGCGEGRFCRLLGSLGVRATGVDPTAALIATARSRDARGTYVRAAAERLPFPSGAFDAVASVVSLVDIEDYRAGIREMARVLAPGGSLLVANSNAFNTACGDVGWIEDATGHAMYYPVDRYLEERSMWIDYRGIRVINHHRPLSAYFRALLDAGLQLVSFDEPAPAPDAPEPRASRYRRAPWFHVMEWRRPAAT